MEISTRFDLFADTGPVPCEDKEINLILHLLAGLEQQKEELGPIAEELIALLYRLGVAGSA